MEKEKPDEICKVDVLYVIGNGSINNDAELLYSLRMLSKNASNVGRVVVCGDVPKFVGGDAANRPSAVSNHRKYMEMGIDMERYAAW